MTPASAIPALAAANREVLAVHRALIDHQFLTLLHEQIAGGATVIDDSGTVETSSINVSRLSAAIDSVLAWGQGGESLQHLVEFADIILEIRKVLSMSRVPKDKEHIATNLHVPVPRLQVFDVVETSYLALLQRNDELFVQAFKAGEREIEIARQEIARRFIVNRLMDLIMAPPFEAEAPSAYSVRAVFGGMVEGATEKLDAMATRENPESFAQKELERYIEKADAHGFTSSDDVEVLTSACMIFQLREARSAQQWEQVENVLSDIDHVGVIDLAAAEVQRARDMLLLISTTKVRHRSHFARARGGAQRRAYEPVVTELNFRAGEGSYILSSVLFFAALLCSALILTTQLRTTTRPLKQDLAEALEGGSATGPVGNMDTTNIRVTKLGEAVAAAEMIESDLQSHFAFREVLGLCKDVLLVRGAQLSGDSELIERTCARYFSADTLMPLGTSHVASMFFGELRDAYANAVLDKHVLSIKVALATGQARGTAGYVDRRAIKWVCEKGGGGYSFALLTHSLSFFLSFFLCPPPPRSPRRLEELVSLLRSTDSVCKKLRLDPAQE